MSETSNAPAMPNFEDCFVNNADLSRLEAYLNRFNPIRVMRMEHMEIRHSAILSWLLDPLETHGFGDEFLRAFVAEAMRGKDNGRPSAIEVSQADLRDAEIRREKHNIDLFVSSPSNGWAFVIENKFHSRQSNGQLERYRKQAESRARDAGKSLIHAGIFLTLHDEEPADQTYATVSYGDICRILSALLDAHRNSLGAEATQFLTHYLEVIMDAAGMSEEQQKMEALAKRLYRSHKKVLDFVMEHGASTDFTIAVETLIGGDLSAGDVTKIEDSDTPIVFYKMNDRMFSFLPDAWRVSLGGELNKASWTGCENWWASYPLTCRFELHEKNEGVRGTLRLVAEVGPLERHEDRVALIECIENAARKEGLDTVSFGAVAKRQGAKYSRFLNKPSTPIDDIGDAEAIASGVQRLFSRFEKSFDAIAKELPAFSSGNK